MVSLRVPPELVAARFVAPPQEHVLLTYTSRGNLFVATCSCEGWYESSYMHGWYPPFDADGAHQHHVLLANYAAGVAPEIKFR